MEKKLFSIGTQDFIKGLITAILTSAMTGLYTSIEAGGMPDAAGLKIIALSGIGAGVAYISKNLLSNSNGDFAKKEPNGGA